MSGVTDSGERRTKIVATVGPATWEPEVLAELIEAGADVLRLNFSHADADRHAQTIADIRAAAEQAGREVAILGDLPGPKLRDRRVRGDVVELETGTHVTLTAGRARGRLARRIPVSWPGMSEALDRGRAGLPRRRLDPAARHATTATGPARSAPRSRSAASSPPTRA